MPPNDAAAAQPSATTNGATPYQTPLNQPFADLADFLSGEDAQETPEPPKQPQGSADPAESQDLEPAEETPAAPKNPEPDEVDPDDLAKAGEGDPAPEDPASEDGLPAEIQAKIDKRIGKEVSKRKALETQLETAQAELAKLKEGVPPAESAPQSAFDPAAPWASHPELRKLSEAADRASRAADQVDELMDDLNEGPEKQEHVLQFLTEHKFRIEDDSPRGIRSFLRKLKGDISRRQVTAQTQYDMTLQRTAEWHRTEAAKAEAAAREILPSAFDPATEDGQIMAAMVRDHPELSRAPYYKMWLVDAINGRKARLAAAAQRGTARPAPVPAPTPGVRPARKSGPAAVKDAAEARFAKNPTREAFAETF
jgi:hypothetical protein